MIIGTVDRSRIMQVQTPQGFMYEEIYQKHRKLWEESAAGQVTDDAQLFETQVFVEGDSRNIKITTRGDTICTIWNNPKSGWVRGLMSTA